MWKIVWSEWKPSAFRVDFSVPTRHYPHQSTLKQIRASIVGPNTGASFDPSG